MFEKAWTVAPLTAPAHATLLTGLLPPKHGLRVNHPPAPLPATKDRQFFTLAEVLRERRFATGAFVSASELRGDDTGLDAGFDAMMRFTIACGGDVDTLASMAGALWGAHNGAARLHRHAALRPSARSPGRP